MPISLFPHNQTAYASLLTVLETEQRACIIHPTGTGKSCIGFKYCEEYPTQTVLWCSPSAYIFKTLCESLLAADAQVPENISYMTCCTWLFDVLFELEKRLDLSSCSPYDARVC